MKGEIGAREAWLQLIFAFLLIPVDGFVFQRLWGWFLVPNFDLPELSLAQSIGLSLAVNYATVQWMKQPEDNWECIHDSLVYSLMALLVGWITHLFM